MAAFAWLFFNSRTIYAPGFSEHNFRKVVLGMPPEQVVALLGNPLGVSTQDWSEVWYYYRGQLYEQQSVFTSTYKIPLDPDSYALLDFNYGGVVTNYSGKFLGLDVAGLTKAQVLEKFGKPSKLVSNEYVRVFYYSESPSSGNYWLRQVHFDFSNRVSSRVTGYYFD